MTDPPQLPESERDREMQAQDFADLWWAEMGRPVPQYPQALPARLRRHRLSMPPAPSSPNGDA
jgi:hypothetical protein